MLDTLRSEYHKNLCNSILGYRAGSTVLSIADQHSSTSKDLATRMVTKMGHSLCVDPASGQTAGKCFSEYTMEFLKGAFNRLQHLRPGSWLYSVSQGKLGIAAFDQYDHLAELAQVLQEHKNLAAALGSDYLITPDIVIARKPLSDEEINAQEPLVSQESPVARHTPLRSDNYQRPRYILHASISCKWTMRSDRAQNSRTEALNLIRNRKGNTPHIVVVTFEPMPTRLASIAMGTGDIDCTYHGALYELIEGLRESGNQDQLEVMETLVNGRRLRDISDLAFDLAI